MINYCSNPSLTLYLKYKVLILLLKNEKFEKIMISVNFDDFTTNPEKYLARVENNNEVLFLRRETGKGSVVMSTEEYNSIMETLHLLKSRKTTDRILESLAQIESGDVVTFPNPENLFSPPHIEPFRINRCYNI